MAATHVDTDQWNPVVEASNGDAVNQDAWRNADGPLADRTLWIRNRILGGVASASGKWVLPLAPVKNLNNRFTWQQPGGGSVSYVWLQTDVTDAGELVFPICMPFVRGNIVKLSVYVHGLADSGASHAGLPGTMPAITLVKTNFTTITAGGAVFSTVNDPSGTLGAYESDHVIEYTGAPLFQVLGGSHATGYIRITGENGANKAVNKFAVAAVVAEIDPV